MKKVLITGCAGFIGSTISERLLSQKAEVYGIDNINEYYPSRLKRIFLEKLKINSHFHFYEEDILSKSRLETIINDIQPESIIHAAAYAGVRASLQRPLLYSQVNIIGTQNILESVRILGLSSKIILISSSSIYGEQKSTPFHEDMQPQPSSPYGASKYAMELVAKQYANHFGMPIVIIRPFSIYGPKGRMDMAPMMFVQKAETNQPFYQFGTSEDNKRDWTYIDDFVTGVVNATDLHEIHDNYQIYNLGNSHPVGIDEFVSLSSRLSQEYLSKSPDIVYKERGNVELPITYANISKAKRDLGYNPKVDLEEGLTSMYVYYSKNRAIYQQIFNEIS